MMYSAPCHFLYIYHLSNVILWMERNVLCHKYLYHHKQITLLLLCSRLSWVSRSIFADVFLFVHIFVTQLTWIAYNVWGGIHNMHTWAKFSRIGLTKVKSSSFNIGLLGEHSGISSMVISGKIMEQFDLFHPQGSHLTASNNPGHIHLVTMVTK